MANILDMPDTTSYYSKSDIEGNKLMAVLSYIGILVLVPILAAKDSPFAKYHAAQGLNLLIVDVAWCIVSGIVSLIFGLIGVTAPLQAVQRGGFLISALDRKMRSGYAKEVRNTTKGGEYHAVFWNRSCRALPQSLLQLRILRIHS